MHELKDSFQPHHFVFGLKCILWIVALPRAICSKIFLLLFLSCICMAQICFPGSTPFVILGNGLNDPSRFKEKNGFFECLIVNFCLICIIYKIT